MTSEFQSICEDVDTAAIILARAQNRLASFALATETKQAVWIQSLIDLEVKSSEVARAAKALKQENLGYFEHQDSGFDQPVDAQRTAYRRLHKKLLDAYRVIRDLANENEKLSQAANNLSPPKAESQERERMREDMEEAMARLKSDTNAHTTRPIQPKSPVSCRNRLKKSSGDSSHSSPCLKTSSPYSDSIHPGSRDENLENLEWSIHYGNPPGSSVMSFGPVGEVRLTEYALINDTDVKELGNLKRSSDLCWRLYSIRGLAFLYDPIFLEARSEGIKRTYILDWGTDDANENVRNFVASRNACRLHTFLFPVEKKEWYYVGAHTWKVVDLWSIWSTMEEESRQHILRKLALRSHGKEDEVAVGGALDGGRLEQLCVEISGEEEELLNMSKMLARKMGYEFR